MFFGFGFGFGLENGVEVRAFRCFIGWLIIHRVSELRSRGSISFDSLWLAWSGFQTISPASLIFTGVSLSLSLGLKDDDQSLVNIVAGFENNNRCDEAYCTLLDQVCCD